VHDAVQIPPAQLGVVELHIYGIADPQTQKRFELPKH